MCAPINPAISRYPAVSDTRRRSLPCNRRRSSTRAGAMRGGCTKGRTVKAACQLQTVRHCTAVSRETGASDTRTAHHLHRFAWSGMNRQRFGCPNGPASTIDRGAGACSARPAQMSRATNNTPARNAGAATVYRKVKAPPANVNHDAPLRAHRQT